MSLSRREVSSFLLFASSAGAVALGASLAHASVADSVKPGGWFTTSLTRGVTASDGNGDGRVDLDDYARWPACRTGPSSPPLPTACATFDVDRDEDIDLVDFAVFQSVLGWCLQDAECDDGLFCNGAEVCDPSDGTCDPGSAPCTPLEICDEFHDICVPIAICGNDLVEQGEDCDDGNRVDGDGCDSNCTVTTCGNSVVTAGEECDDGNDVPGDGCDATCRRESPGPANDYCANAGPLSEGTTSFNTDGATTDGPAEPSCGFLFDDPQIGSDVWFRYTATCTGDLVLSLCGSLFDTKMAVYDGTDCPTGTPLACSDDDCGNSFASRVVIQATPGQSFLIRVGGYLAEQGDGQINLLCDPQVCGDGNGTCTAGNGTPGCEDADCCETTCALDPYCCDFMWDQYCADEAAGLCTGSFPACAPGAGSCSASNQTPGCEDVDCCNTVCMQDPFCCVETWDETCAAEAFGTCFLACGAIGSGPCFSSSTSPGCENESCCEAVCTIDPFCCETLWDSTCADIAANEAAAVCRQ
jgi:cysteine-rich repeat protein